VVFYCAVLPRSVDIDDEEQLTTLGRKGTPWIPALSAHQGPPRRGKSEFIPPNLYRRDRQDDKEKQSPEMDSDTQTHPKKETGKAKKI
jgi:hypothetical protein